jgi:hypothetical protein
MKMVDENVEMFGGQVKCQDELG